MEKTLQAGVENVLTWLIINRLKLNLTKLLCMFVGSGKRLLILDNAVLKSTKYWVYRSTSHLTWQSHEHYALGAKLSAIN